MDIILASGFIPPLDEAYESFGQKLNENLTWLVEVEHEAAAALQRSSCFILVFILVFFIIILFKFRTGIELLPKTPSQRSKKKRKFPSRPSLSSRSNSYSRPPSVKTDSFVCFLPYNSLFCFLKRVTRQKPKSNDMTKKSTGGQQPAKEYELPISDVAMKSLEELPATNDVATPQKETEPTVEIDDRENVPIEADDRENAPVEAQTVVIDDPPSNDAVEEPIIAPSIEEDIPDSTDVEKEPAIGEPSPKKPVAAPPPASDEPRMMTRYIIFVTKVQIYL